MKVIVINGPVGVGKTVTGKLIAEKNPGTAFIGGDWCMDLHPFVGNRETNAMIADAKELNIDVIELKATEDGYDLYRSVGFEDDRSKYHLMKWKAQREA